MSEVSASKSHGLTTHIVDTDRIIAMGTAAFFVLCMLLFTHTGGVKWSCFFSERDAVLLLSLIPASSEKTALSNTRLADTNEETNKIAAWAAAHFPWHPMLKIFTSFTLPRCQFRHLSGGLLGPQGNF